MSGDLPAPALRLLTTQKVTTHCKEFGPIRQDRTEFMRTYMREYKRKRAEQRLK